MGIHIGVVSTDLLFILYPSAGLRALGQRGFSVVSDRLLNGHDFMSSAVAEANIHSAGG